MADREELRTKSQLREQDLLPTGKYGYGGKYAIAPPNDRRRTAIESVLKTLPQQYFAPFMEAMKDGIWFIPSKGLWGKVAELPQKRITIYLPPTLEFLEQSMVESLAAHEILHVALGHKLTDCSPAENDEQEKQIEQILNGLGYPDPSAELTKVFNSFPSQTA